MAKGRSVELRLPIEQAGAVAGDEAGTVRIPEREFGEIHRATARPLWAFLCRVSGDPGAADDLLQETYCRFLRSAPAGLGAGEAKSYLYKIATNLLRDRFRSRRPQVAVAETPTGDSGRGIDIRTDLGKTLAEIGERERELLWLAYAEGFSHREIAAATGLRESSIRPLLFRARAKMAALLRSRGYASREVSS